jgi:hypothetical protein
MRLALIALGAVALLALGSLRGAGVPEEAARNEELHRLLKARYEAAAAEMEATTALFKGGRVSLNVACDAIQRFSSAGIGAARTQGYRLKVCEHAFGVAKEVEDVTRSKFESDVEPVQAMRLATYTRLDMEIKLHEARRAEAAQRVRGTADDGDLLPLPPSPAGGGRGKVST